MNSETLISKIAKEQNLDINQVQAIASLLGEGSTIPLRAIGKKPQEVLTKSR